MKTRDAIVIGAGIIGLSLAIELNKRGLRVLVVEKGEPGREASWAAGGMLCDFPLETQPALRELAAASAQMYPEFVRELEDESGLKIDLRSVGTLIFINQTWHNPVATQDCAPPRPLAELEPALRVPNGTGSHLTLLYAKERCVDPRHLTSAAIEAARHRGVEFSSGDPVLNLEVADGKARGVRTSKTQFAAGLVVNCAGAWAGQIGPHSFPTRPVKGQMLCVALPEKELVRHVVRTSGWTQDVYLIPRSDGRMLIGATSEEAGFDKQTVPETLQKLRQAAIDLVPRLAEARILEAWAGLRPGTPDKLPILGPTATPGYFVATGHFRDGILLAPVTAKVMGQVISGEKPEFDLKSFEATRFQD
ncbi:MAG: glycine oxidase ThiO [Terriglobales bacterium]